MIEKLKKKGGKKICIICEGYEEEEYIEKLINIAVFSSKYHITKVNAKSINSIVPRYQDRYQSDSYDIVLIFCDTDKAPHEKYKRLKKKINEFHDADIADDIIIFGNPCTMQIILSHFAEIQLTSQSKSVNSKYIKKHIGIDNYKATEKQRKEIINKIKRSNYETMKKNVAKLSDDDSIISSTNILKFLDMFESDDISWIDKVNKKL